MAAFIGYDGIAGTEQGEVAAFGKGLAVLEGFYIVFQCGQRTDGVLHLVVHAVPVDLRVIEVVQVL